MGYNFLSLRAGRGTVIATFQAWEGACGRDHEFLSPEKVLERYRKILPNVIGRLDTKDNQLRSKNLLPPAGLYNQHDGSEAAHCATPIKGTPTYLGAVLITYFF